MATVSYDTLVSAALDADLDEDAITTDYSGRGMYGDRCLGLVYDYEAEFIRFVLALYEADVDSKEWLPNVSRDSMGRGSISYWPRVTVDGAPDSEDEEDDDE